MPIYYILLGIFQDILLYLLKVSQGPLSLLVVIFSNVLAVGDYLGSMQVQGGEIC